MLTLQGRLVGAAAALALTVSTLAALTATPSSAVTRSTVLSATLGAKGGGVLASQPVRLLWDGNDGAPVRTLATRVTGADGSVALDWVPTASDRAAAAPNGGWFNLTVFVGAGDSTGVVLVPRRWTSRGWVGSEPGRGVATRGVQHEEPLRFHMQNMTGLPASRVAAARSRRLVTRTWSGYTRVANVPSGVDMWTRFDYGSRADSEIGVFVSSGNGWGSAGTTHLANTEARVSGRVRSRRTYQYKANLRYQEDLQCVVGACWYERKATSWLGGIRATRIRSWNCRHGRYLDRFTYPAVDRVVKYRGDNRTYDIGASVAGLEYTAKSGYSRSVDMTIHFRLRGGATRKHFCVGGSNHHWNLASTVYASSRP